MLQKWLSLQVQQSLLRLNHHLTVYTELEHLLTVVTEKLDVTEQSLDKYYENGNIELIAVSIRAIKVQLAAKMIFRYFWWTWDFNVTFEILRNLLCHKILFYLFILT